jgi:sugar O-acyltransferase (sialic acid O-acetyltransferase NeuD family)
MSRLAIFGLGNHVVTLVDCALALGHQVHRVVLNQPEVTRPGMRSTSEWLRSLPSPPQLIAIDDFAPEPDEIYALGFNPSGRSRLVNELRDRFGLRIATLVHPTAYVSPLARLGEGVSIAPHSVVQANARIGDHVHIGTRVTITHGVVVEPYALLLQGCNIGGHAVIGHGSTIGMGANILEERVIGAGAFIAAGAVVTRDVEAGVLVAGVPAQVKRRLQPAPP